MKKTLPLAILAVALLICAWIVFMKRAPREESTRRAEESAVTDPAPETERWNPTLGDDPRKDDTPAEDTDSRVLRVILEGIPEDASPMTTVTVAGVAGGEVWPAGLRDSWPCQGLTTDFELDAFLAEVAAQDGELRVEELEVQVDHPKHLPETSRVSLSDGEAYGDGRSVYEVRVRLDPSAAIHGRVVRQDGTPAIEGLVGAQLLEDDFPVEDEGYAVVCESDGSFELRVPTSGIYALVSYEEGYRPTTTRVETFVGERIDVDTLALEVGHSISGHVLRQGNPLAGATVGTTPPTWKTAAAPEAVASGLHSSVYEGRTFKTPSRSVHLLWLPPDTTFQPGFGSRVDGRFELRGRRVETDEDGAFTFGGLGTGEYLLGLEGTDESHAAPGGWGDRPDGMVSQHGGSPGIVVRPPVHGVVLEFHRTSIRFELSGDLESGDEGRLVLRTPSHNPTKPEDLVDGRMFVPEYWSKQYTLRGSEPTFVLHAWPNKAMTGEVAFPGRQPVPLDFRTPESGGEVVVPVELVRAEDSASLVIEIENPRAEIPDRFTVMLWRDGHADDPPEMRPAAITEGQLRVENILSGKYRVVVCASADPNHPGMFFNEELELELPPALVVTRSVRMRKGSGLRVTVRGDDGALVTGQYEFYDDDGNGLSLVLGVGDRWKGAGDRWVSSWKLYPHGTHESTHPIPPGRYRLVLRAPGYEERSVTVDLREGEVEPVDVTLTR